MSLTKAQHAATQKRELEQKLAAATGQVAELGQQLSALRHDLQAAHETIARYEALAPKRPASQCDCPVATCRLLDVGRVCGKHEDRSGAPAKGAKR